MSTLAWILIAYGMTNILVYGSIFNKQRNFIHKWGDNENNIFYGLGNFISGLISCIMCTSTWVGFFLSLVFFSPTQELFDTNEILSIFFDGMLASGSVWAVNAIIEWFEENRPAKID
jgi:hypothetical protein